MNHSEKVFIYFNIKKKVFSVRSMKSGLVIAHVAEIYLDDATFKVSEKGRQRVLRERRKNIHAGIEGFINLNEVNDKGEWKLAGYNPYKNESFIDKETMLKVEGAHRVKLTVNNQIPKMEYIN